MACANVSSRSTSWSEDVELWVKAVVEFSSEYNNSSWAANNVIGEPRVYPRYGDIQGAWAQGTVSANEFIVVQYAEKLYIESIEIYETLNAGAVVKISAWDTDSDRWVTRWQAEDVAPQNITSSRCFTPPLAEPEFATDRLKLELNCTLAQTWCEIDSVKVRGKRMLCPQPPPLTELSTHLRQLVNNDLFSDVTFEVDGHEVRAHRAILSARSEYFRAMLCGGLKETTTSSQQTISVNDVSFTGFLAMMQFIYANDFDDTVSPLDMAEIIRIGDRFSLEGMKTLAFCRLCASLSVDNVIDVYQDAVGHLPRLGNVEELCLSFIARHLERITRLPTFCELSQDVMLCVIQEATARLAIDKQK